MAWQSGQVRADRLNGDDLDDQVVGAQPACQYVCRSATAAAGRSNREALPGEPDGCAGDVEAGGVEAEGGDVFGVSGQAAAEPPPRDGQPLKVPAHWPS